MFRGEWGTVCRCLAGMTAGKTVSGEPLTTALVEEYSPSLLQSEIDERITKIRPMSTPIDQISRYKGARKSGSMVVDYYSVDLRPTEAVITSSYIEPDESSVTNSHTRALLSPNNSDAFEVSDTIMVQGIKGYESDGTTQSKANLVLYVVGKDVETGKVLVSAVNGKILVALPIVCLQYTGYASDAYGSCRYGT